MLTPVIKKEAAAAAEKLQWRADDKWKKTIRTIE
jgi:hypothetical protein